MENSEVVHQVRQCLELLAVKSGLKAVDYGRQAGGWTGYIGDRYLTALDVEKALVGLPVHAYLAIKVQILANDPHDGWAAMRDLACFVDYHLQQLGSDSSKFGRACLEYWVVYWARADGSAMDAFCRFGGSRSAQQRYWAKIKDLLDSWFVIAKGRLEVLLSPEVLEVA